MEGSQSCQFLLRFNVRMMLILLRALHHTLSGETAISLASDKTSDDDESCITFVPNLLKMLPLFRLYIAFTYVIRADLVQYQDYLEPHIKEVYQLLADILTSLNLCIDSATGTAPSKYLLSEDTEAQGLRSLSDRRLPLFLHVEEQRNSNLLKRTKTRKPQQTVFGRRFKQETEAVWRIRDIMCCGVFLAGSAKFPIVLTSRNHHGRDTDTWLFVDGAAVPLASNEAALSRLMSKLNLGDLKSSPEKVTEPEVNCPTESATNGHIPVLDTLQRASLSQSDKTSNKGKSPARPSTAYQDSDLSEDSEMINMVNKLLDPVDDVRPQPGLAQIDPSYGMHSSTANEIFGNLEVSPAQPSPLSKAIPSLPWDYFYKPTPHRSSSQEQNHLSPNGYNIPRSAAGSSSYLDDLSVPFNHPLPSALSPRPNTGYMHSSPDPKASSPGLPRKDHGLDTLEGSRNAVLDSLASALHAQHGLTRTDSPQGSSMLNRTSMTPTWGQQNGTNEPLFPQIGGPSQPGGSRYDNDNSFLERSAGRQASAVNSQTCLWPSGQGRPGLGQTVLGTGGGRLPATITSATKNLDAQNIWGQGPSSNHQQYSPWQYEPSTTASSLAFSHPSSLLIGTPGAVSAAPANSVACNGHYYNGTTPFGRLGEGVNNRADPTHFRNQLKAAIGTSELPYDQQILQGALMDNNRKPRPK
jgi:hypothetical protein